MLAIFDKWGERHPVSVIHIDNCEVIQKKTDDTEGYTALQLGVGHAKIKRVKKVLIGHYRKAGVEPKVTYFTFNVYILII